MAYDLDLADRLRAHLGHETGVVEKRMFGGLAFLIEGRLAVSVGSRGGLLLRVDPAQSEALIADPRASRFVMRGREMAGWLQVDIDAATSEDELGRWVDYGVGYAQSLDPRTDSP